MTNVQFPTIDDYRDVDILNMYREQKAKDEKSEAELMRAIYTKGRDNARTPMQWSAEANAGFNDGGPTWIKVNPNYPTINVEHALANPDSILYYYKKLIALRKQEPLMVVGKYALIEEDHPSVFAYTRTHGDEALLVLCNMYEASATVEIPQPYKGKQGELVLANVDLAPTVKLDEVELGSYEARVYKISL
jgi:glycosidase